MTWFKVDDTLAAHPKARAAGLPALGLWVVSGSYVGQQLTDGFVPDWFPRTWPSGQRYAERLVEVGLWQPAPGGWQFHEWQQSNPTRRQVTAEREASKKRQQAWRDNRRSNGVTDGVTNAAPTRPDPTRPSSTYVEREVEVELPPADEVERVVRQLRERAG